MGMGRAWKGSHALTHPTFHVPGEPGAKPLVEDLLLGRGFVGNRAASLLRSIERQPLTQVFGKRKNKQQKKPQHSENKDHGIWSHHIIANQFSSVTQSCLTLCDPMDFSTPGFPVYHQHLELTQTHVH